MPVQTLSLHKCSLKLKLSLSLLTIARDMESMFPLYLPFFQYRFVISCIVRSPLRPRARFYGKALDEKSPCESRTQWHVQGPRNLSSLARCEMKKKKSEGYIIKYLLTRLGRVGWENVWLSVMTKLRSVCPL